MNEIQVKNDILHQTTNETKLSYGSFTKIIHFLIFFEFPRDFSALQREIKGKWKIKEKFKVVKKSICKSILTIT